MTWVALIFPGDLTEALLSSSLCLPPASCALLSVRRSAPWPITGPAADIPQKSGIPLSHILGRWLRRNCGHESFEIAGGLGQAQKLQGRTRVDMTAGKMELVAQLPSRFSHLLGY